MFDFTEGRRTTKPSKHKREINEGQVAEQMIVILVLPNRVELAVSGSEMVASAGREYILAILVLTTCSPR